MLGGMVTNALEQHAPVHAVELDGASRRFGGTLALDDCRLIIEPGETVALLGRNGAGKSTAIGLMLGLLDPSAGRVRTLGLDPRTAVRSGRVGAMLQALAALTPGHPRMILTAWLPPGFLPPQLEITDVRPSSLRLFARAHGIALDLEQLRPHDLCYWHSDL